MQTIHPVAKRSAASQAIATQCRLIDDLRGGTDAMRAAGERHLPRRLLEEREDYDRRLACATLLPVLAETIKRMVGRVFAAPLQVDGVPTWIESEVLPDVDRQGRNLHVWAREWFDLALGYGLAHVLVDSPAATGATVAEQRTAGIRPYLVTVRPQDVLGWRETDGQLSQLRVQSSRTEPDGDFGERTIEQVRVYEVGRCDIWEKNAKGEWVRVETVVMGLKRIPLITLYTQRTGFMTAAPPLRELARLNVKHWQLQSSIDTLLDTATVPILVAAGFDDGDKINIGAKQAVRVPMGGKLEFCEHSGAAIGSGTAALEKLELDMRQAGARLLEQRPGGGETKTAKQVGEEANNDNSDLGAMALQLQDTLTDVLDLVAEWRGEAKGGMAKLQPNLEPDMEPTAVLESLQALHRDGIVSRPTVFQQAQMLGFLPEALKWEDEQARISEEGTGVGAGDREGGAR